MFSNCYLPPKLTFLHHAPMWIFPLIPNRGVWRWTRVLIPVNPNTPCFTQVCRFVNPKNRKCPFPLPDLRTLIFKIYSHGELATKMLKIKSLRYWEIMNLLFPWKYLHHFLSTLEIWKNFQIICSWNTLGISLYGDFF